LKQGLEVGDIVIPHKLSELKPLFCQWIAAAVEWLRKNRLLGLLDGKTVA
jgi:hypothetical protein